MTQAKPPDVCDGILMVTTCYSENTGGAWERSSWIRETPYISQPLELQAIYYTNRRPILNPLQTVHSTLAMLYVDKGQCHQQTFQNCK